MKKYYYLSSAGLFFILAGVLLMLQMSLFAQEAETTPAEPIEPPFLAEFYMAWFGSGHADTTAVAFNDWNEDGAVPETCAKCHSTPGYLDFLGVDGSEFGVVNVPAAIGTTVECDACHNSVTISLDSVTFPSGLEVTGAGDSARCMQCHQGRSSGNTVNANIEKLALTDANAANAELGFVNIHYYAAAATLYGSEAAGGYQFEGKVYQMKNEHVPGYETCADCHNPHTLEVKVDECAECHEVDTAEDLPFIRMPGSASDYDGDGDWDEGISEEISTLQEMLMTAMQAYATNISGAPFAYSSSAYPYFFNDLNGNGEVDEDEANRDNKFVGFSPNLLKAAYNYQVTLKDPGGYAHNPTYHIELLFDSIEMLNQEMAEPAVDLTMATRSDPGHFDTTAAAFRNWDEQGEVSGSCSRCHTSEGLPTFLKNGVTIAEEPSNSLTCSTCHDSLSEFSIYTSNDVPFPSGAKLTFGEDEESNLCLNCHQGRESTVSVDRAITGAAVGDDESSEKLAFRNIHYFAAGASLFGDEAKGAYQYADKAYSGRNMHVEEAADCASCHDKHELTVRINKCEDCHEAVETPEDLKFIRMEAEDVEGVDYDGDGDATEPILDEIMTFKDSLYVSIQAYALNTAGAPIGYNAHAYPYWFADTNGDGTIDEAEAIRDNGYKSWTPNLLRAAYNYQFASKDPGLFAHNSDYAIQFLYDSLESVGGAEAVATFTRPEVKVVATE